VIKFEHLNAKDIREYTDTYDLIGLAWHQYVQTHPSPTNVSILRQPRENSYNCMRPELELQSGGEGDKD